MVGGSTWFVGNSETVSATADRLSALHWLKIHYQLLLGTLLLLVPYTIERLQHRAHCRRRLDLTRSARTTPDAEQCDVQY